MGSFGVVGAGLSNGIHLKPTPPKPPAGSYNPDLDAARAAAGRGILDTRQDIELGLARAGQDYTFGKEDVQRTFDRGTQDLTTAHQRNDQDFATNTNLLQRSFNILAGQQAGQQRQMGVAGGGAALQAAAKRQENQGIQQTGLNTSHQRANENILREAGRLGEDRGTGLGRLGVGYNRQVTDFGTQGYRAERENKQYGLDIDAQRYFQAAQTGWEPPPPTRPKPPKKRRPGTFSTSGGR